MRLPFPPGLRFQVFLLSHFVFGSGKGLLRSGFLKRSIKKLDFGDLHLFSSASEYQFPSKPPNMSFVIVQFTGVSALFCGPKSRDSFALEHNTPTQYE